MFQRNFARVFLFAGLALALSACGAGSKVVSNIAFTDEVNSGDLYAGIDATLAAGSIFLPASTLPLYNPNNPSQVLGQIETNGLHIIVRVNASEALRLPNLVDGAVLPNGASIPLTLPAGLKPVGIPVFNSNSVVYVAINGNQILVGVAVTIAKNGGLNLPLQLFLPFTIDPQVSGTAGFFLGDKQGVAVFALKDSSTLPKVRAVSAKIDVKSEAISSSTLKQFERAQKRMRGNLRID